MLSSMVAYFSPVAVEYVHESYGAYHIITLPMHIPQSYVKPGLVHKKGSITLGSTGHEEKLEKNAKRVKPFC